MCEAGVQDRGNHLLLVIWRDIRIDSDKARIGKSILLVSVYEPKNIRFAAVDD